jgi:TatD DNase family protein
MIDIHCHLEFMENPEEVLKEAKGKMTAIITSVADPKNAKKILSLREKYKDFLFVSLGFHPECLMDYKDEEIKKYIEFIKEKKNEICAIGEVGLDYSQECQGIDKERMKKVFILFIDLAKELNLPLVIHARDAFNDALEILKEKNAKDVVLHCFSGSEGNLKEVIKNGYFISFATNVCYTKKHPRLAEKTPIEKMLLETDSPWLDPENPRGMENKPWKISFSAKVISKIKGIPERKVLEIITKNTKEFFKLPF